METRKNGKYEPGFYSNPPQRYSIHLTQPVKIIQRREFFQLCDQTKHSLVRQILRNSVKDTTRTISTTINKRLAEYLKERYIIKCTWTTASELGISELGLDIKAFLSPTNYKAGVNFQFKIRKKNRVKYYNSEMDKKIVVSDFVVFSIRFFVNSRIID